MLLGALVVLVASVDVPQGIIGYAEHIERARLLIAQERYLEARVEAVTAREANSQDPESYETLVAMGLLELREILSGRLPEDEARVPQKNFIASAEQCKRCGELVRLFEEDMAAGLRLADDTIAQRPFDARVHAIRAKLAVYQLWFLKDVLEATDGARKEIAQGRAHADAALRFDSRNVQARVAKGILEFVVGSQGFFARYVLGGGDKEKSIVLLRETANCANCSSIDRLEAKVALFNLLRKDKRCGDALAVARELAVQIPEARSIQQFIAEQGSQCGKS